MTRKEAAEFLRASAHQLLSIAEKLEASDDEVDFAEECRDVIVRLRNEPNAVSAIEDFLAETISETPEPGKLN